MDQNPDEDVPFILFPLFPGIPLPTPFYLPATLR
ncbi:rCG56796, isoform CRA_a [Rattus norvegicus]|uniref:RCG56796, isoform CRA_a n=1 Tax=Rattus norvegicus TaxID=10116 RepID=A6KUL0_RAT|nr:rCG56796, isoform CRA_a [Rattus norvegicus]